MLLWCDLFVTFDGEYEPSPTPWVRDQVGQIEATGDTATVHHASGRPIVLMSMRGARSGKVRKVPVMRVEHDGSYLAVASRGGAPENPQWYHNLLAHPDIDLLDGTTSTPVHARLLEDGPERDDWWQRAVAAFPAYADYQVKTSRAIPLFVLEPRDPDVVQP